jgi:uncharacterized protein (DUF934 family)
MQRTRTPADWVIFDGDASRIPAGASVLIPLDEWRERAGVWRGRAGRIGVLLAPGDDATALDGDLDQLALVAVGRLHPARSGTVPALQIVPRNRPALA